MVNKVILIGFMGKDPEVRFTSGGQAVASLRVATSRGWTDRESGERKEETEWHDVEVWGKAAEACGEYLAKGGRLYVEGRIKTDRWKDKQSGQDRSRVKIVADSVRFIGRGASSQSSQPEPAQPGEGDTAPGEGAAA